MSQQENFNTLIKGLKTILSNAEKINLIRPSQQKVLQDFIQNPEQFKTGIFNLATAFGKTRIMALLADAYRQNAKNPIIVVEPTRELVGQVASEFSTYFGSSAMVGQFFSERKETKHPIVVTTYNSLKQLAKIIGPQNVGLLLLDEGHHAVSDKRMEIVRQFSNACQYGMTATPDYSEDRTLKSLLKNTIAHVDIRQGIQDGILSPFSNIVLFSTFQLDLSQVKRIGGSGDYDIDDYRRAFSKALGPVRLENSSESDWKKAHRKISHEIALFYQSMSSHKKHCLINCHTQEEAQIQAEEINKVFGRPVAGVWTTNTQKTSALTDFESGRLGVLCQVGMLQEGYDFPALDLCINYPTASPVRATQRGGRTLRLDPHNPDKQATIVDIIFRFPGSQNPYTSARKNNQILYSDVVHAISIAPKLSYGQKKSETKNLPKIIPLHLDHFKLVSDTKTLLTLKRKDQQKEAAEYIPFKEEGMLTIKEYTDKFGGTPNKYQALFQEIYSDPTLNTCTGKDNNTFQLICYVRSGNTKALCLSNHPEALKFFSKICEEKYHRRNTNKISLEEYAKGHYLPQEDLFRICSFLHRYHFRIKNETGTSLALIAKYPGQKDVLLLEDTNTARSELHSLISLTDFLDRIPTLPDDMCDLESFKDKMAINDESIDPFIRRFILEGKTYTDKNGQQKPLAQFYTREVDFKPENTFGICIPRDLQGQMELLRQCKFHIFHCDAPQMLNYNDNGTFYWNTYVSAKKGNKTLREVGDSINLSRERVRQIFVRIQRDIWDMIQDTYRRNAQNSGQVCLEPTDKDLFYLFSGNEGLLMTKNMLNRVEQEPKYHITFHKTMSKIIITNHWRFIQSQERNYSE